MNSIVPQNPPQKQCTKCKNWLPLSEFCAHRNSKDKLNWRCRECANKNKKKDTNVIARRERRLRLVFGITSEQYDQMLETQGGVCAICKGAETNIDPRTGTLRRLAIDHDHKTGEVRALLCTTCNITLGRLGEDPKYIEALLNYALWCKAR